MKLEICSYSGYKVYPGHGKRAIRGDGRQFYFLSSKCERSHHLKRNPREVNWTVLYRRKYRKGAVEELTKKRTKRVTKTARAIAGASLTEIMAKRNQKPEVRKAMREQAMRAIKEKQKAKEAERKSKKAEIKKKQTVPAQQKQKAAKKVNKPAPKGGKRF
uniref:Large ribosomal subunit protein eL24 n=1 Tax=Schistocephalus solidus TaxID=70667 RepID=A0A0X3NFY5_SCHSO